MPKFTYEDICSLRVWFYEGDLFKFDIKHGHQHGHHHVNVDKAYHKYLGFPWSEDGVTKYYVFTVLVFGSATATFVFTNVKVVKSPYWILEMLWHSYF